MRPCRCLIIRELTGPTILIECRECCFQREFQTRELLAICGPEYRMIYLRYDIANCVPEEAVEAPSAAAAISRVLAI